MREPAALSGAVAPRMDTVKIEDSSPAKAKAGRREWIGLAVLALPCLLYSMDLTVLHLAVPSLSADLRPSSAQLLWIIDIYGFLVAGSLVTMGTLGDRIGRRRMLLFGAAAFSVGSLLAAFSTSANMLIVTRALLGLAGATVAPSTLSLIRNMFPDPRQRTFAISVWMSSYSLGGAIGPVVGGALLEFFWWGSVFLLNIPVMLLLLVAGPKLLPEYRDENAGRPDLASAVLSLMAVLAVIFGLKQLAQSGLALTPLLSILAGVSLGFGFVRRQRTLTDPLLDLHLFSAPTFVASLTTYGSAVLVLFGGFLFLPQYLQLVLGLSPLHAGLWTLPWGVSFVVGSILTPLLARRIGPAVLMAAGLVFAAFGFALFTRIDGSTSFFVFSAGTMIFSLGLSPVFTLTTDLIIGSAPPERAGAASAISETSGELGGALGIALFGSIGVAVYRKGLAGALPVGLSSEASGRASATLAEALMIAEKLPGHLGSEVANAARSAFIAGLRLCAGISAAASLALAIVVLLMLRSRRKNERAAPRSA
jgi:DHA2 family multidrug resistance protein-like MFS transporter